MILKIIPNVHAQGQILHVIEGIYILKEDCEFAGPQTWLGWMDGQMTCADRLWAPAKGEGAWLTSLSTRQLSSNAG